MTHIHKRTGMKFEVGFMPNYDMTVITQWPESDDDIGEEPIRLVDFYFGEPEERDTDYYIDQYLEKQERLKDGLKFLEGYYLINCIDGDYMNPEDKEKLKNSIDTIKQMI